MLRSLNELEGLSVEKMVRDGQAMLDSKGVCTRPPLDSRSAGIKHLSDKFYNKIMQSDKINYLLL